jgi:ABC-type nitrate/sulfonate/bicarbonate transport system ATPase subunit
MTGSIMALSHYVDIHPHIISNDDSRYPRSPLFGVQSEWSRERPMTIDQYVAEMDAAGVPRGFVFQHASLLPWRNALHNVEFGLELQGIPAAQRTERARKLLALVGLGHAADQYPHQLSGGMQQRIGLARALAIDPAILLMDEPFSALDAQTREVLQAELLRIHAETAKTTLFVTHDLDEAIYLILSVFPVLINTAAGVRNVPRALIDVSTAFAANERQVFVKIILPSAVPYMMTGLRLGIGRAIIGMVVAEFFTAITGLGALIVKYGNRYDTASMFVPILVLMALGILLTSLVRRAEEQFAPWRMTED